MFFVLDKSLQRYILQHDFPELSGYRPHADSGISQPFWYEGEQFCYWYQGHGRLILSEAELQHSLRQYVDTGPL